MPPRNPRRTRCVERKKDSNASRVGTIFTKKLVHCHIAPFGSLVRHKCVQAMHLTPLLVVLQPDSLEQKVKKQQELLVKCKAKIHSLTEEKAALLRDSNQMREATAEVATKLAEAKRDAEELRGSDSASQQLKMTVR